MNVLVLNNTFTPVADIIRKREDNVVECSEPIDLAFLKSNIVGFIVSHGYKHIIKPSIINYLPDRIINLHISLLPWNRGADPNLWSFLEDTPKGVTIHCLDDGIDTGDILAQQEVDYMPEDTLRTSYERLSKTMEELFRRVWPNIRSGKQRSISQPQKGSYHRLSDRAKFEYLLTKGWNTPIADLLGKAKVGSANVL